MFDNIVITTDKSVADEYAMRTYGLKVMNNKANSASLMSSLVEQANDKPWLYAVYVLVIVLPLIFLVTWCCRSSDKVGEQKKTDAPQPDDEHNSDQEAEEEAQKEASGAEEEADNDVTKAEESEKEELGDGDKEASAAEESQPEEEVEEKESGDATSSPRQTRRRKPRKD